MKKQSVLRVLLAFNALSLDNGAYHQLDMIVDHGVYDDAPDGHEYEEALVFLDRLYRENRINQDDYKALSDVMKCAAASLS